MSKHSLSSLLAFFFCQRKYVVYGNLTSFLYKLTNILIDLLKSSWPEFRMRLKGWCDELKSFKSRFSEAFLVTKQLPAACWCGTEVRESQDHLCRKILPFLVNRNYTDGDDELINVFSDPGSGAYCGFVDLISALWPPGRQGRVTRPAGTRP